MTRFKDIKVDKGAATVEVGAGLTWDQVYAVLDSHGVNVIGGRIPGVGVAGLALGGGEPLPLAAPLSCLKLQITCRLFLAEQSIRPHSRQYRRLRACPAERDHHVCDFRRHGSLFCAEGKQRPTWHRAAAFGLTIRNRRGDSTTLCVSSSMLAV